MDISSVNSDLIRGNVTTIILNSLSDGDRYGYDILKEIELRSGGMYKLKQPTLYSCLKRLEKNGLISSYSGDPEVTGGGQRKYYRLTDEGRKYLDKEKEEYEYSRTILDKLVSDDDFDFSKPAPFNADELRPYTKPKSDEKKVVYKEKIVYKYIDNPNGVPMGIIPEDKNAYLSDAEIAYLENSAMANQSKIYSEESKPIAADDMQTQSQQDILEAKREDFEERLSHTNSNTSDTTAKTVNDAQDISPVATEDLQQQSQPQNGEIGTIENADGNNTDPIVSTRMASEITSGQNDAYQAQRPYSDERYQEAYQSVNQYQNFSETYNGYAPSQQNSAPDNAQRINAESNASQNGNVAYNAPSEQSQNYFGKPKPETDKSVLQILDEAEQNHKLKIKEEKKPVPTYSEETVNNPTTKKINLDEFFEKKTREKYEREGSSAPKQFWGLPSEARLYAADTAEQQDREYATSYVTPKLKGDFEFEKNEVQYVDFYDGLTSTKLQEPKKEENGFQANYSDAVLQNRLYSKGYNLKPYQKAYTQEFYLNNFVYISRMRRDSNLLGLVTYLILLGILWATCYATVTMNLFIGALAVGVGLYLIPLVMYFINPKKKAKAKFNFKYAMLNSIMLFVEISVIIALVGFFIVGADVANPTSTLAPIVIPIVLVATILFLPIYHGLLYRSKKYHVQ